MPGDWDLGAAARDPGLASVASGPALGQDLVEAALAPVLDRASAWAARDREWVVRGREWAARDRA